MSLKNKKILLIVGGGISAYKSLDLIRLLQKKGSSIKVILTKTGKNFVTSLSVSSLSKNRVFEDTFDEDVPLAPYTYEDAILEIRELTGRDPTNKEINDWLNEMN